MSIGVPAAETQANPHASAALTEARSSNPHAQAMRHIIASQEFKDFNTFVAFLPLATRGHVKALYQFFRIPRTPYETEANIDTTKFVSQRLNVLYLFIFPLVFSSLLKNYAENPGAESKNMVVKACDQFCSTIDSYMPPNVQGIDGIMKARFQQLLRIWCKNKNIQEQGAADEIFTLVIQIFSLWPVSTNDTEALCALLNTYPCTTDDRQIITTSQRLNNILAGLTFFTRQEINSQGHVFHLSARDTSPAVEGHGLEFRPLGEYIGGNTAKLLVEKIFNVLKLIPCQPEDRRHMLEIIEAHINYQNRKFTEYLSDAAHVLQLDLEITSNSSLQSTPQRADHQTSDIDADNISLPTSNDRDKQLKQLRTLITQPNSSSLQVLAKLRAIVDSQPENYSASEKIWASKHLYEKAKKDLTSDDWLDLERSLKQPENKHVISFIKAPRSNLMVRGWKPQRRSNSAGASPGLFSRLRNFLAHCLNCFRPQAVVVTTEPQRNRLRPASDNSPPPRTPAPRGRLRVLTHPEQPPSSPSADSVSRHASNNSITLRDDRPQQGSPLAGSSPRNIVIIGGPASGDVNDVATSFRQLAGPSQEEPPSPSRSSIPALDTTGTYEPQNERPPAP